MKHIANKDTVNLLICIACSNVSNSHRFSEDQIVDWNRKSTANPRAKHEYLKGLYFIIMYIYTIQGSDSGLLDVLIISLIPLFFTSVLKLLVLF